VGPIIDLKTGVIDPKLL